MTGRQAFSLEIDMFTMISQALDRVYKAGAVAAGTLLVALCCLVLYSTFARSFGLYAGGATDIAGYVMATGTFTALAYTLRAKRHIRISLIANKLTGAGRHVVEVLCLIILAVITCFVAWYMTQMTMLSHEFQDRSQGADGMLLWIPQAFVSAGSCLFALAAVHSLFQSLIEGHTQSELSETSSDESPQEI